MISRPWLIVLAVVNAGLVLVNVYLAATHDPWMWLLALPAVFVNAVAMFMCVVAAAAQKRNRS